MKKIDIFSKLRSSGLRPTKQRVEIAKFLFERDKTFHFTVESLGKLLEKKTASKCALATIYNTVHAFISAGHLKEVEVFLLVILLAPVENRQNYQRNLLFLIQYPRVNFHL